MVAVISRQFGLEHIETAEDIVSETFLTAAESWGMKGLPPNPTAWLYTVAKQKTLYHFRRNKLFDRKVAPAIVSQQEKEQPAEDLDFSLRHIQDSQLQMLFAICNPAIAGEAQIGLALRILCGFGIDEIAEAFLTSKDTINKRLFRAKEKLRTENVRMELPPEQEIVNRLDNVLHIIYLLFNEGYYSQTQDQLLRKDLCIEALRLGLTLTAYAPANRPKTNALIALMCFHASRFDARGGEGLPVLYDQQDESLWDRGLIEQGRHFLQLSAEGDEISSYHLEARIAYWHCIKEDSAEKWEEILFLYDRLLLVNYAPGVALNRVFAFWKVHGRQKAVAEAEALGMENDHFYWLLLGELYTGTDDAIARRHFNKAYNLAKTQPEKTVIRGKIDGLAS